MNIPSNHRVKLDIVLPDEIPTGLAEMIMIVESHAHPRNDRRAMMRLAGRLKHSKALRGDPVSIQKGWRDEW